MVACSELHLANCDGRHPGGHLALVGPTATGKSALALALARRHPELELISADSMCVYAGMDIGTAKPTPAQQVEGRYHLIDLVGPDEDFSVSRFQAQARVALADIESRGHRAVLVGGTGLYLRAVLDDLEIPGRWPDVAASLWSEVESGGPAAVGSLHERLAELDPLAASRMEAGNARRVVRALEVTLGAGRPFSSFGPGLRVYPDTRFRLIGLDLPGMVLDGLIAQRFEAQLARGFVPEVARLAHAPGGLSQTARQALGYRELLDHVEKDIPLDECTDLAVARIRRFARRQRSWFKRDPRIAWLDAETVREGGDALLEQACRSVGATSGSG
ncbi:MAG: tRNA (adenosine(37)-N6)-dimethylallyltransferase MiaA [Acidimicrobiales bacterium]